MAVAEGTFLGVPGCRGSKSYTVTVEEKDNGKYTYSGTHAQNGREMKKNRYIYTN
jgi:hypothetical protein